jgi:hypothetical protein
MLCPRCNKREIEPGSLVLGVDFGLFCRRCKFEVWFELLDAVGVSSASLIDLTADVVDEVLAEVGQRVLAAARGPPPTTDHGEIVRRLAESRSDWSASGPPAA